VDEIDELIEMAADARKRLVDAQRQYDEIKRRIGRRVGEVKQAETAEVQRPVSIREANHLLAEMLPVKAPVVDGVVDYDAQEKAQLESWHKRYTYPMERVACQLLATTPEGATMKSWRRLEEFRALNAALHSKNDMGTSRAAVRLGALIVLVNANGTDGQSKVVERWKRLLIAGRGGVVPVTMALLVQLLVRERMRLDRRFNMCFFMLAWAAMSGRGPYADFADIDHATQQAALAALKSFHDWMTGDQ
jgi:hypothetical protein